MTYRERLTIPWWWALVAIGFVASIAVVVIFSLNPTVGIAVSILTLIGVAIFLGVYSATPVTVGDGVFTAGRNTIERQYISSAEPLSGDAARRAVGVDVDPKAFLFTRPFIRDLVRVHIDDPADPHPYWLVSTRHPQKVAEAIEAM